MSVGSILGRVIDATGTPVVGASVAVSDSPLPVSDIAVLTGVDGRFSRGNLAPGSYTFTAHNARYVPGEADVIIMANQQSEVEIRLVNLSTNEAILEVDLVTDRIVWDQIQLVRVTLNYNDPDHGIDETADIFFSPTDSASQVWTVPLADENKVQYSYKIVYFFVGGFQKNVGSTIGSAQELILDLQD